MPYVNIQIVEDDNTTEQKAQLIEGVTRVLVEVLGRKPESVFVVIDEVPQENWGIGYQSIAARRAAAASAGA